MHRKSVSSSAGCRINLHVRIKKFLNLYVIRYTFIPIFLSLTTTAFAQPKTNLEVFYTLIDSSSSEILSQISQARDSVKLETDLGESYSIFSNRLFSSFLSKGKKLSGSQNIISINYVVDEAKVVYGEIFRDGWFGDYYISRTISIKGNYLLRNNSSYFNEYNFSFNDSIKYDEIAFVENESFGFTKGNIPPEPFFSGLFEPVVAIGTAALAVILFFTIRSK